MIQFLRSISLVFLIASALVELEPGSKLLNKESLFVISNAIVLILIFVDAITAFILALAVITLIVKLYSVKLPWSYDIDKNNSVKLVDYITPENLENAQSNRVINKGSYDKGYKGIEGVYGEDVYDAQGLEILPGL